MEKRKNKIPKKALAFASALIIILSLCSTIAFAQAPEITTNNNPNLIYYNVLVYDDIGSQGDNVLAYFHVRVSNSTFQLYSIDCVLTDYYYNEYYLYDYFIDLSGSYDITISSRFSNAGGPGEYYKDEYIVEALNHFNSLFYSGDFQTPLLSFSTITNCVSFAINNQFIYWENQVDNAYDFGYSNGETLGYGNGYNNGLSEGQEIGYDEGYLVGKNDGYNSGLTQGYTNAINDKELVTEAFFEIFNAPFVFVQQIVPFEIFGINLFHIFAFFLIIALAIFMFKILGKVLPL